MSELSQVSIDQGTIRVWAWILCAVTAAAILWFGRKRPSWLRYSRASIAAVCAAVLVTALWPSGLGRVQPGARGVVLRFGAPTGRIAGEGLYYVVPFAERVVQVNTQINTVHFDRAQAITHDLEPVYADFAASLHVEPDRVVGIYRFFRDDYVERIVDPAVQDAWKATAAGYTTSDLIARRPEVERDLENNVQGRLRKFGLSLDAIATTRFNFSYTYSQAAQAKVASVQRTLQAQQELQRIRFEAQQNVIRAQSEVQAMKLQRDIPVAQLIRMRQLDLGRRAIDKWDGRLPTTTGTIPFLGGVLGGRSD
jgi:regulator of protease activity HflC (stomatin/prohibitin superfamily)